MFSSINNDLNGIRFLCWVYPGAWGRWECTSFSDLLGLLNRPIGCFGKLIVALVYGMANINAGVLTCQEKNILFEK